MRETEFNYIQEYECPVSSDLHSKAAGYKYEKLINRDIGRRGYNWRELWAVKSVKEEINGGNFLNTQWRWPSKNMIIIKFYILLSFAIKIFFT